VVHRQPWQKIALPSMEQQIALETLLSRRKHEL